MNPWQQRVAEFNEAIGVSKGTIGCKADPLAMRLITEEYHELLDATELPDAVDAIGDMIVVLLGLAHRLGVDMDPVMAEIFRANTDKLGGPKREDGKQLKPQGWRAPEIEMVLREQGWER